MTCEPGTPGYINPLQFGAQDQQIRTESVVVNYQPKPGQGQQGHQGQQEIMKGIPGAFRQGLSNYGWKCSHFSGLESLNSIDFFEYRRESTLCSGDQIRVSDKQRNLLYFWGMLLIYY